MIALRCTGCFLETLAGMMNSVSCLHGSRSWFASARYCTMFDETCTISIRRALHKLMDFRNSRWAMFGEAKAGSLSIPLRIGNACERILVN